MIIFNQGKYRSLHAQQEGELSRLAQQVAQDHDFRPSYHIAPATGLLNDPNGLVFDGENYHIFYQWHPFSATHGMKHWQHLITKDFLKYQQADLLIPEQMFESHGCYSGGALTLQDHLYAFYTGNTRRESDNQRVPQQNLAIFNRQGKLLEKRNLIAHAPQGYTEHVRDPKPYLSQTGSIRFVLGAQRENLTGTALIYEMKNLENAPHLLGELTLNSFDNQQVFMWECPDLSQIGQNDLFIWSPQGKKRETFAYQNNYHAVYALGKLTDLSFEVQHYEELDYGFDFYAPQTFTGLSQRDSGVMLAWCGLPDLQYPTDRYQWHSMLTLPRQISVHNQRLYQKPLPEIYQSFSTRAVQLSEKMTLEQLDCSYLCFDAEDKPFTLTLFNNAQQQHLMLSYQDQCVTLDRSHSEQSDSMQQFGHQRYCRLTSLRQVEIFIDRSIIEIYLNNGEKVLTSRFFIAQRENQLTISRTISAQFAVIPAIQIEESANVADE